MRRSNLKTETKVHICAAPKDQQRINYIKCRIDRTSDSYNSKISAEKDGVVWHIASECTYVKQREYKWPPWLCVKNDPFESLRRSRRTNSKHFVCAKHSNCPWKWELQVNFVGCNDPGPSPDLDIAVVEKRIKLMFDYQRPGDNRINVKEED